MLLPSLAATGILLSVWGSRVDLSDFITLVSTSPPEGSPTPSIPCMLTRFNPAVVAELFSISCLSWLGQSCMLGPFIVASLENIKGAALKLLRV